MTLSSQPRPRKQQLEIVFGALARKLSVQLKRRDATVRRWQRDADAITRLLICGLITPREGHAARQRLMKVIAHD